MNTWRIEQKQLFSLLLAISMLGTSILACSLASPKSSQSPKPSHYGVFFEEDGELIELQEQEIFNIPIENQMGNVQAISDSQPAITVWRSNTNLDYLEFLKLNQYLGESKISISYNATPKDDGIIEIKPKSSLEDGVYCIIQGDPLAVFLSGWCFKIRSMAQIQPLPISTTSQDQVVDSKTDYFSECYPYEESKEWEKAVECYQNWTLIEPENYYIWRDLGRAYSGVGNSQQSLDAIVHSLSLATSSAEKREAYLGIGVRYYNLSDFDMAISYLEQGASIIDISEPAWRAENLVWLSRSYEANGQSIEACQSWMESLEFATSNNNQWAIEWANSGLARCP